MVGGFTIINNIRCSALWADAFQGAWLQLTCIVTGHNTSGFSAQAYPLGVAALHSEQLNLNQ